MRFNHVFYLSMMWFIQDLQVHFSLFPILLLPVLKELPCLLFCVMEDKADGLTEH